VQGFRFVAIMELMSAGGKRQAEPRLFCACARVRSKYVRRTDDQRSPITALLPPKLIEGWMDRWVEVAAVLLRPKIRLLQISSSREHGRLAAWLF